MQPLEIIVRIGDADTLKEYVLSFTSIHDLVVDWMKQSKTRTVRLGNGLDDDDNFTLICLSLRDEEKGEVFSEIQAYYSREEVTALFREYSPVRQYFDFKTDLKTGLATCDVDQDGLTSEEKRMGFKENFYIGGLVADTDAMIPYMMTYAQSECAEATIGHMDTEEFGYMFFDEEEVEEDVMDLSESHVFWCHTMVANQERTCISHSDCYFIQTG